MTHFNAKIFDFDVSAISTQDFTTGGALQESIWIKYPGLRGPFPMINIGPNKMYAPFYHEFSNELLSKTAASSTLNDLYAYISSLPKVFREHAFGLPNTSVGPDSKSYPNYHKLSSPYSLYTWEAGLHAPMLLIDKLASSQQYDQALEITHYIFDPRADGTDIRRVWKWIPFGEVLAQNVLRTIFDNLEPNTPNTPDGQINSWRNNPFQPHVIARSRPVAYMKWVVMKYISILIASGDQLFRQNTLESVPLAIQRYILAAHLYGPPGQKIPERGKNPAAFNTRIRKLDAFRNAEVDFENAFPFSNQTVTPSRTGNFSVPSNILGTARTLYFYVLSNTQLQALRTTIDDRLYKIRHCQDINGNTRKFAPFEPQIDPAALVQAAIEGLSLSNVLQDLNTSMPNYRFQYLLQKAFEMVQGLKSLGPAFISAKEKKDSEAYQLVRAGHEATITTMVLEMKKLNLQEATKTLGSCLPSPGVPIKSNVSLNRLTPPSPQGPGLQTSTLL